MLKAELETQYYVYPSWIEVSYKWEDLPWLMAHPLESGYIDTKTDWKKLGYPEEIAPCSFIDGPAGGGIVVADRVPRFWLPAAILSREANLCLPNSIINWLEVVQFKVNYIEPFDNPLLYYFEDKPRPKLYICSFSPENVESDPDSVYWVVNYKKGRKEITGLNEVPTWAKSFGLSVTRLPECPQLLREETSDWFRNPENEFAWYQVQDSKPLAGLAFAIVMYIGLHLRKVAGSRMRSMHLLSGIEGKPNMRKHWARR